VCSPVHIELLPLFPFLLLTPVYWTLPSVPYGRFLSVSRTLSPEIPFPLSCILGENCRALVLESVLSLVHGGSFFLVLLSSRVVAVSCRRIFHGTVLSSLL